MMFELSSEFVGTLPASLRPLVSDVSMRPVPRVRKRNGLRTLGVKKAQRLICAAAALAERSNFEVIQVFQQKWRELKQVLAEPANVTVDVLCSLKDDAAQKVSAFCRWFHMWSASQHLALGQP